MLTFVQNYFQLHQSIARLHVYPEKCYDCKIILYSRFPSSTTCFSPTLTLYNLYIMCDFLGQTCAKCWLVNAESLVSIYLCLFNNSTL